MAIILLVERHVHYGDGKVVLTSAGVSSDGVADITSNTKGYQMLEQSLRLITLYSELLQITHRVFALPLPHMMRFLGFVDDYS